MSKSPVLLGATFPLNTFVGHEFEMREVPSEKTGVCRSPDQTCRQASFVISENDNQVARVSDDFEIVFKDNKIMAREEASDLVEKCQSEARAMLAEGASTDAAMDAIQILSLCVESNIAKTLERANEEIAFQASVRKDVASHLENYTCADETLDTTEDLETRVWDHHDGVKRTVHVKHERPASRIHVIENFISEEECKAMEESASKTLHRATVADGKGGSQMSDNRKAMQAGIKVQWDKEHDEEGMEMHIAQLSRRVYDYTNHVLGLDIKEDGQEDLMSIQYFGRGLNDTEPDRYTPHCDGDCTGLPHKYGTRMATMVMYCTLPTKGGSTNFRNSGVHVKPVKGNAIFFSYIDPETKLMDNGFTEHSGCPVYEGEKKIVTQWIRYGVDKENTWDSFNTLGIKMSEANDQ
jgi:predicted GIY-YIG superfamily endonuclease